MITLPAPLAQPPFPDLPDDPDTIGDVAVTAPRNAAGRAFMARWLAQGNSVQVAHLIDILIAGKDIENPNWSDRNPEDSPKGTTIDRVCMPPGGLPGDAPVPRWFSGPASLERIERLNLTVRPPPQAARPPRARVGKRSLAAELKAARRAGAAAATLPSGVRVSFGEEPAPAATTELDDWVAKHAH
jgi:hypothetical protein